MSDSDSIVHEEEKNTLDPLLVIDSSDPDSHEENKQIKQLLLRFSDTPH